ncbi:hypothetical protein JHK82_043455 [Glycine max]|nr:hypothetical protein JHK82_043455 [Glycine max]
MRILNLSLLVLTFTISLSSFSFVNAFKRCPNCGQTRVPYPLSTAPNCGDPSYKIRCTGGTLFFDSINGFSYAITAINPTTQRFILHPSGFLNNTCMSTDFPNEGIWLDTNSPFNITSSNTGGPLKLHPNNVFTTPRNCSLSSICHKIRVRKERCSAYFSFPNLDPSLPVSMWRPGVELEWELPEEPSCRVNEDCLDWKTPFVRRIR